MIKVYGVRCYARRLGASGCNAHAKAQAALGPGLRRTSHAIVKPLRPPFLSFSLPPILPHLRGRSSLLVLSPAWKVLRFGSENYTPPDSCVVWCCRVRKCHFLSGGYRASFFCTLSAVCLTLPQLPPARLTAWESEIESLTSLI